MIDPQDRNPPNPQNTEDPLGGFGSPGPDGPHILPRHQSEQVEVEPGARVKQGPGLRQEQGGINGKRGGHGEYLGVVAGRQQG